MENLQKKPLYALDAGVVESEVELLPRLREVLQKLTEGWGAGRRIYPLVKIRTNECWEWSARRNPNGYCYLLAGGKTTVVHKYVYKKMIGEYGVGLVLDHLCRNRFCCNPKHLQPVTSRENILRGNGKAAENARKTHCPLGHSYSSDNLVKNVTGRECRTCRLLKRREWYKLHKGMFEKNKELRLIIYKLTAFV